MRVERLVLLMCALGFVAQLVSFVVRPSLAAAGACIWCALAAVWVNIADQRRPRGQLRQR